MLWLLNPIRQISFSQLAPLLPGLSPERQRRIARYRHEPSAVQSALAELLLRCALEAEYGIQELPNIQTEKQGKPYFPECPGIHFNLSHCKNAVACALDRAPVGVDVESYGRFYRDSEPSVFRILSEPERRWILAVDNHEEQDRRFTAVWTCKESYGKARGLGILYDLKNTEFLPQAEPWTQYGWSFQLRDLGDCILTLCSSQSLNLQRVSVETLLKER